MMKSAPGQRGAGVCERVRLRTLFAFPLTTHMFLT